jgi:hypothetical protein
MGLGFERFETFCNGTPSVERAGENCSSAAFSTSTRKLRPSHRFSRASTPSKGTPSCRLRTSVRYSACDQHSGMAEPVGRLSFILPSAKSGASHCFAHLVALLPRSFRGKTIVSPRPFGKDYLSCLGIFRRHAPLAMKLRVCSIGRARPISSHLQSTPIGEK